MVTPDGDDGWGGPGIAGKADPSADGWGGPG
jgi:hypothetical protein